MSSPCLARLLWKPQLKMHLAQLMRRPRPRSPCQPGLVDSIPLFLSPKCHDCMPHHRRSPLHLHNLHLQREGRTAGGGWVLQGGGGWEGATASHVQLRLAMRGDKYGSMRGAHATAGFDDYTTRRRYDTLIDSEADPTPPRHLRSHAEYRRNRNRAESLCTLEVHWSKTVAWLFINQLSLANCLLRWTAQVWWHTAASAPWRQHCWHHCTAGWDDQKTYITVFSKRYRFSRCISAFIVNYSRSLA